MIHWMLFSWLAMTASGQEDFTKIRYQATPVAPGLSMLEGAGGNVTALIGSDGTLLVDDDFAEMAPKLLEQLRVLGGAGPRYVINTHFHYDHTGGNAAMSKTATVIASEEVRERLRSPQLLWHKTHPAVPIAALPTLTFRESLTLHFDSQTVEIYHLPSGHTDGDGVVFFKEAKVAALGDLYFAGMYPIFHPEHHGSLDGLIRDLEWVLDRLPPGAKVIPGHGPMSNREQLADYLQMIRASVARVRSGRSAGKTLAELQQAGLDPKWERYSHGYRSTAQWIEAIDQALREGSS